MIVEVCAMLCHNEMYLHVVIKSSSINYVVIEWDNIQPNTYAVIGF